MNCAKCGLDLPDRARHCPKCGWVNELASAVERKKLNPMVYAIGGLAVIALIAIVIAVMAARGRESVTGVPGGGSTTGGLTNVPSGQGSGGGLTNVPGGTQGTGSTTPSGTVKPKPPKSVVDYLEFVRKVEEHRQTLLKDTTNALTLSATAGGADSLLKMIDMASNPDSDEAMDPLADTKKELKRQYTNWLETLKYFAGKQPPPECTAFSKAYYAVLYNETKVIGDIHAGFDAVNIMDPKDMQKLLGAMQKMKNDPAIQTNIDRTADDADGQLTALVSNYDMKKPFDVPREQKTSGSIMGF